MIRLTLSVVLCCFLVGAYAIAYAGETWDKTKLDTARGVDYLSAVEKDVVFEINKLRSEPSRYAELYLIPKIRSYSGKLYKRPSQVDIMTSEGVRALEECISHLKKAKTINPLLPSRGLSRAAADHAIDQAETGSFGHIGKDGSSGDIRMNRYGKWGKMAAENISYGQDCAQEIIFQMLVDDGVPSRGHRKNLMQPAFRFVGVAIGSHPQFGYLCVINFTGEYRENNP